MSFYPNVASRRGLCAWMLGAGLLFLASAASAQESSVAKAAAWRIGDHLVSPVSFMRKTASRRMSTS